MKNWPLESTLSKFFSEIRVGQQGRIDHNKTGTLANFTVIQKEPPKGKRNMWMLAVHDGILRTKFIVCISYINNESVRYISYGGNSFQLNMETDLGSLIVSFDKVLYNLENWPNEALAVKASMLLWIAEMKSDSVEWFLKIYGKRTLISKINQALNSKRCPYLNAAGDIKKGSYPSRFLNWAWDKEEIMSLRDQLYEHLKEHAEWKKAAEKYELVSDWIKEPPNYLQYVKAQQYVKVQ